MFALFDKNCVEKIQDIKIVPFIPSHKRLLHKPGDLIEVLPRLWPGINKPGGPARVLAGNEQDSAYDVKVLTRVVIYSLTHSLTHLLTHLLTCLVHSYEYN